MDPRFEYALEQCVKHLLDVALIVPDTLRQLDHFLYMKMVEKLGGEMLELCLARQPYRGFECWRTVVRDREMLLASKKMENIEVLMRPEFPETLDGWRTKWLSWE